MYSRAEKFTLLGKILIYTVLVVWTIYAILPLHWVFTTAFKSTEETVAYPPTLFPKHFTLKTFVNLFAKPEFGARPFMNSIIISLGATFLALFLSSTAGYGFSRFRFPLRRFLLLFLLFMNLLPKLIMIIRCRPEESVLIACKQFGQCTEANGNAKSWASS